jgi:hypothetical protein
MKTQTIKLSDFYFRFSGHGCYEVTYTSPCTRKEWKTRTTNMRLIDNTKNAEFPLIKDLEDLKYTCKNY